MRRWSNATVPLAVLLLPLAALLACEVPGSSTAPGKDGGADSWAVDPVMYELYSEGNVRGQIAFDVSRQRLHFDLRDDRRELDFEQNVADLLPGFLATSFTRTAPGALLLGGRDLLRGEAGLARVSFEATRGEVQAELLSWEGPRFEVASGLDVLPDGRRLAVLDHRSELVLVYDPQTGRMRGVASSGPARSLSGLCYVHAWPAPTPEGGHAPEGAAVLWVTEVDEAGVGLGTLAGRSVRLADPDGDGVFE